MATPDIDQVRNLTDGAVGFTDVDLQNIVTAEGGVKQAAVFIWRSKAASYSALVDVSESGSSRSLGDLHKQALTIADSIAKDITVEAAVELKAPKTTRRAVRR